MDFLARFRSLAKMLVVGAAMSLLAVSCGADASTAVADPVTETPAAVAEPTPVEQPAVATVAPATPVPATSEPEATPSPDAESTTDRAQRDLFDRAALIADLEIAIDDWLATSTAPGISFSLRLPNEEPINIARGVSDLETGEPVTVDDYFRIASITKTMAAATALQLVDEGLLELDAPVATYLGDDWLGEHANGPDITVAQLMNHTNGLIEYAFDIGFYRESLERLDRPYTPDEILDFLARQPPLFAPGVLYRYETGGFVALGKIIEQVTGNSAAAEMRARVFEPAGAQAIFLTPQEFPPEPVVHGYVRGELFLAFNLLAKDIYTAASIGDDPVLDVLSGEQAVLQSAGWTGGGNEARLESVAAIWKAMFDGTILSPAAIDAMTTTVLNSGYGLGLSVTEQQGTTLYSHGGGVPGFRSQAGYLPEYDISYAFSVNLIPLPDGADVAFLTEVVIPLAVAATGGR